jgi:hypothetical protein
MHAGRKLLEVKEVPDRAGVVDDVGLLDRSTELDESVSE